jgi:hypothetical protein
VNQKQDAPKESGRKLDKQLLLKILAETSVAQKDDAPADTSVARISNLPEMTEDSSRAKQDS